jgi:hypothetical protein
VTIVLSMNCHSINCLLRHHPDADFVEAEGPASCGDPQVPLVDADSDSPRIPPWLLVMIAAVALALTPATLAQTKSAPIAKKPADATDENAQLYRNPTLRLRYRIPYGWVDRTEEMRKGSDAGKSDVLLGVFERPPEATGDTINSAVVIASESAASYPGLKEAEDYLGPLTELATAKGFKAVGEPYALEVGSRHLLRADFAKPLSEKLTMRQCTLVLLAKGQVVSFTFIAGSDDDLDDLMDGLHFDPAGEPPKPHP